MLTNFSNGAGIGVNAPQNASAVCDGHDVGSYKHTMLRLAGILAAMFILSGCACLCPEGNGKNHQLWSAGANAPVAKNVKGLGRKRRSTHRRHRRIPKPDTAASKVILDLYLSKSEEGRP
ncbi:MAG: hypothetical protein P8Y67_14385 [Alphaproteobacteria bacterium]